MKRIAALLTICLATATLAPGCGDDDDTADTVLDASQATDVHATADAATSTADSAASTADVDTSAADVETSAVDVDTSATDVDTSTADVPTDTADPTDVDVPSDTTDAESDADADTDASCPEFSCFEPGEVAADSDGDGCNDVCCGCPTDFQLDGFDVTPGACIPFCSDARCSPEVPCSNYLCNLGSGTCAEPSGFCSDAAVCGASCDSLNFVDDVALGDVCGCDGNTWASECEMYCNGVALDYFGACE